MCRSYLFYESSWGHAFQVGWRHSPYASFLGTPVQKLLSSTQLCVCPTRERIGGYLGSSSFLLLWVSVALLLPWITGHMLLICSYGALTWAAWLFGAMRKNSSWWRKSEKCKHVVWNKHIQENRVLDCSKVFNLVAVGGQGWWSFT